MLLYDTGKCACYRHVDPVVEQSLFFSQKSYNDLFWLDHFAIACIERGREQDIECSTSEDESAQSTVVRVMHAIFAR